MPFLRKDSLIDLVVFLVMRWFLMSIYALIGYYEVMNFDTLKRKMKMTHINQIMDLFLFLRKIYFILQENTLFSILQEELRQNPSPTFDNFQNIVLYLSCRLLPYC
jgi:hypothetical protein